MKSHFALTLFVIAALAGCGASESAEATSAEPAVTEEAPAWIPADFEPPTLVEGGGFKVVPLGPDVMELDYKAYMSSIDHLRETFTRGGSWPHAELTLEDAVTDMDNEARRFRERESFAYAVLTPDGSRERGCVYVHPSKKEGYGAMVRMWVTQAEFDAGFDGELYAWAQEWVKTEWPLKNVAYPGRAIPWDEWEDQ